MRREGVFAVPGRGQRRPYRDPAKHNHNSWERGITGEHRADGSFMPYVNSQGNQIRTKEYAEGRRTFESIRRDQISAPSNEKVS
jgi:hypothetical protein